MDQDRACLICVDAPAVREGRPAVVSPFALTGWVIAPEGKELRGLEICVNGSPRTVTGPTLKRPDVKAAFPSEPNALWSGFAVEVFVDDLQNASGRAQIKAIFEDHKEDLLSFEFKVEQLGAVAPPRQRSWFYSKILACPECLRDLREGQESLRCRHCRKNYPKRRGTPVFFPDGGVVATRLLETCSTHPYADEHLAKIEELRDGIVLDLGAGNPRESLHRPNVVLHEFVQYPHTDVASTCARLPYKNDTFDAVVSQAVFEHLARPWEVADELYRVMKPGAILMVDVAFMQPFHGDPHHYFNMTVPGVRELFRRFKHLKSGVKPYQNPAFSLRMQIDVMLEHLESEEWRNRLQDLRERAGSLASCLDQQGQQFVAAGVFFQGIKPTRK